MLTKILMTTIATLCFSGTLLADDHEGQMTPEQLLAVTKLALDDFAVRQVAHAEHLLGYTTWRVEGDAKVKVLVNHDGMSMNFLYLCHNHDGHLECHAQ